MEAIRLYLEKFKDWRPSDEALKNTLQEIIKRRWGVELKKDDISWRGSTVYLKVQAVLRGEILIHQEEILAELSQALNKKVSKLI